MNISKITINNNIDLNTIKNKNKFSLRKKFINLIIYSFNNDITYVLMIIFYY